MPKDPYAVQKKDIPLSGKLITVDDGATIGTNFTALQNMRYTDTHPQGILGMTKINSTNLANPLVRSAHHFKKAQPVESHVLVQAYDVNGANPAVYRNDATVPATGNFNATPLHTDAAGAQRGLFATATEGAVVYANSVETMIWGGNETRMAAFVNYDPAGTFKLDQTDVLTNTLSDATNCAVLVGHSSAGIDTNTKLLLHLDNNVTDSETTPKTVTNVNVTYSAAVYRFGYSGVFDGATAYLTTPDHADFNFSGGKWTIDGWIQTLSNTNNQTIYAQITDANNWLRVFVDTTGAIKIAINASGTETIIAGTIDSLLIPDGAFHQVEISEKANWYRIFVDGILQASVKSTERPANYTGIVYIGARSNGSSVTDYFNGYIDEFRVSNLCRHTTAFEVPSEPYDTSATTVYCYIGATRPLSGINPYVKTANGASGTIAVYYWNGSAWVAVSSLADGTAGLHQTGSITFTDTSTVAKMRVLDQLVLYWYKIVLSASTSTSLYYVTLTDTMQPLVDLWDGTPRTIDAFEVDNGTSYVDYTNAVYDSSFSTADPSSFCNIGGVQSTSPATDSSYTANTFELFADFASGGTGVAQALAIGFSDRMRAVHFYLGGGNGNTTASTVCYVYYWNGSAWQSVGTVQDGTSANGISMAGTGIISWDPPSPQLEVRRSVNTQDDVQLYYYRFVFTKTLSNTVDVYYATGIPAPIIIYPFKFPVSAMDRIFLCSNQSGPKNQMICSSDSTSQVFNGSDSATFYFGDDTDLTAACWLYSQYGTTLYNTLAITKTSETYILVGDGPSDWVQYQVSPTVGCPAPQTMVSLPAPFEIYGGTSRTIAIWQGNEGIYMFDGKGFMPLHGDIEDYWDRRKTYSINRSMITSSQAFYDQLNQEYHWIFASGTSTTLDTEFAYDIPKKKWFQIERGTGKKLQCGMGLLDTSGNMFNYGFLDTGYMERLEYGNDFDGNPITYIMNLGDIPLEDLWNTTAIRKVKLLCTALTNTTSQITLSHWGETSSSTSNTALMDPHKTGFRVAMPILSLQNNYFSDSIFHKFGFTMTAGDEPYGLEILGLSIQFERKHETK